MKDFDMRFKAQRSRNAFKRDSGTNSRPTRDIIHTFAGLIRMERYDRIKSPATIIINRRDVIPNIFFIAIAGN